MVIRNTAHLATTPLRADALAIAEAGYAALDIHEALTRALRVVGDTLTFEDRSYSLAGRRVFFVGIGKCAFAAAPSVEELLGERLVRGIALDPSDLPTGKLAKIVCRKGTHPLPSDTNESATRELFEMLKDLREDDFVLVLVSGGGSTLLCFPDAPMTSADEALVFEALTHAGATIQEINTVRKHLSRARGGGVAAATYPAEVLSLVVSDVPGDPLPLISSGPTVFDESTVADAQAVLDRHHLTLPHGSLIETPKDRSRFARVTTHLLVSNDTALTALTRAATELGYQSEVVTRTLTGEARDTGAQIAHEIASAPRGVVRLYAGETTVTISGAAGKGGRNQELALGALAAITDHTLVLACASDGHDNSEHAGAIADTETLTHARTLSVSVASALRAHSSYDFFSHTNDALTTGYTGSNVSDFIIAVSSKSSMNQEHILWMRDLSLDNVPQVGGKNASLGEMIKTLVPQGVRVPEGFCVTAAAYHYYLEKTGLDTFVETTLKGLDTRNLRDLAERGKLVREKMRATPLPADLSRDIQNAYRVMEKQYGKNVDVAVRSSATAEDLPGASFAGEHETYLNIRGSKEVERATVWAMASLFTDRAISYRADKGFEHTKVALSVGVQKMVRSDKGASGVMFSVDTESGFKDVVVVDAVWGLGEMIVQGRVTPDEYLIRKSALGTNKQPLIAKKLGDKQAKMLYASGKQGVIKTKTVATNQRERDHFVLTDAEATELARWGALVEKHYSERAKTWTPMDMEWAKDGLTGELYIVQARPETVQARRDFSKLVEYHVSGQGKELVRGISVGAKAASGVTRVIKSPKQIKEFKQGEILVTEMTDPDWEPIMKMASAIVTDRGGRTSHAAIVSRELGLPAIVGAGTATKVLKTGTLVTVDTSGAVGVITAGKAKITTKEHVIASLPDPKAKIMVNIASPDIAFENSFLPVKGVGLAREEFIIASEIGVHPLAVLNLSKQSKAVKKAIALKSRGWKSPVDFYVDNLAYGIAKIGTAFAPRPVIVRFSDFKTNEYATLIGGEAYEPVEANPMIGWRGASRYYDPKFEAAFALECRALVQVRDVMGLENVIPMLPFCRTIKEAEAVLKSMRSHGLVAKSLAQGGEKTTPVYMMCEIPSNVLLADEFLDLFDGMSIGSNDLTQLTLGLDRDSGIVTHIANENDESVRALISLVIRKCKARGKYLGICGQGPSDLPDFAAFLVTEGIESMSLNPDSVVKTIEHIATLEATHAH